MYRLNVFYYYYCTNMLYLYGAQTMKFQVYIISKNQKIITKII